MDALVEIFRRAATTRRSDDSPVPLVNIVVDEGTFTDELRRATGDEVPTDPSRLSQLDLGGYRCQTLDGTRLHPADAVAAALAGHVRRVVLDSASNVIDLGRRRRLFTGSSRDAALLQAALRQRSGCGRGWPGCHVRPHQIDHRQPAARGGPTNIDNAEVYCGTHNRIKERGYTPVRERDGTWTIHRPDNGPPITPSA